MSTLAGKAPEDTYIDLLKLASSSDNDGMQATLVAIEDGAGTDSAVSISDRQIMILPAADGANVFEVQQADTTAVLTVDTSTPSVDITGAPISFSGASSIDTSGNNLLTLSGGTAGVRLDNSIGLGTNANAGIGIYSTASYTNAGATYGQLLTYSLTTTGTGDLFGLHLDPSYTINQASAHDVYNIWLGTSTVTETLGTVGETAQIYIEDAITSGGTDYSIFVDAGESRFDGDIGDATNRVPEIFATDVDVAGDVWMADGGIIGIESNEIITFNASGTINFTGAVVGIGATADLASALHLKQGDAGGVTIHSRADNLVIEEGDHAGLSIAVPDDNLAYITFESPSSSNLGNLIEWSQDFGGDDMPGMAFRTGGAITLTLDSAQAGTFAKDLQVDGAFRYGAAGSLTISAGGAVAVTKSYHTIVVNGGAGSGNDQLDTATGGAEGDILILKPQTSGGSDTVTVADGTGADTFILTGGGAFAMDHVDDRLMCIHNGTEWVELSRSSNS